MDPGRGQPDAVRLRLRTAMQMYGCVHACRMSERVCGGWVFLELELCERLRAPVHRACSCVAISVSRV
eukprot:1033628-Prymnesium_polylepis.1